MLMADFNPRAPCGARQVIDPDAPERLLFQPTRPLRGATVVGWVQDSQVAISTHAPLAGRDQKMEKGF